MRSNLAHKQVELLGIGREKIERQLLHTRINTGLDTGDKVFRSPHEIDRRGVFIVVVGKPLQHRAQALGRGLRIDVEMVLMGKAQGRRVAALRASLHTRSQLAVRQDMSRPGADRYAVMRPSATRATR